MQSNKVDEEKKKNRLKFRDQDEKEEELLEG